MIKVLHVLAIIDLVLGVLGSFIFMFDGNVAFGITSILVTCVSSACLYSFGEILDYLETINNNLCDLYKVTMKLSTDNGGQKNTEGVFLDRSDERDKDKYWRCAKCGKMNPPYTGTCSCGNTKE